MKVEGILLHYAKSLFSSQLFEVSAQLKARFQIYSQ